AVVGGRASVRDPADAAVGGGIGAGGEEEPKEGTQGPGGLVSEKGGTEREGARFEPRHTRLVSDVGERAIPVVVIKDVAAELGHEQVGIAVIVVVSPDTPQTIASAGHTRRPGHVRECAVAIVVVQRVASQDTTVVQVTTV